MGLLLTLVVWAIIITVIVIVVYLLYKKLTATPDSAPTESPDPQTALDILDKIQNPPISGGNANGNTGSTDSGSATALPIENPKVAEVSKDPEVPPVVTQAQPLVIPSDAPKFWGSSRDGLIRTDTVGRRYVNDIKSIEEARCPSHVIQFFGNAGSGMYSIGAICDDGSRLGPWGGNEGTVQSTQESKVGFKNIPVMYNYDFIGTFFGLGTNKKSFGDKSKPGNLTCPDGTRVSGLVGQYTDRLRNIGVTCKPI